MAISPYPLTNKCIVLDLDHTLLNTQDTMTDYNRLANQIGQRGYMLVFDDKSAMWGVTRPHLKSFLRFCFSYFKVVIVWSAGTPDYVKMLTSKLFGPIRMPHLIFTREHVDMAGAAVLKPLSKLYKHHPVLRRHMGPHNTLVLDDWEHTFSSNKENGILIPAYKVSSGPGMMQNDETLIELRNWLMQSEVVHSQDVRTLNKNTIFGVKV